MEQKEQEVAESYLSSLADLNLNSKPLINMLTILAEEDIECAPVIVKAVEQHISKANPDVKLPGLYLIDSIVKNVGREYINLFSLCIVNIFCGVFEKVNEKIREKMYTLRQTWNDVFTPQKLFTLDVKVNCMDPNWPITAKVPKSPAIHVNPNFFKNKAEPIDEMHAKLRDKQRQLLELQKRKLELELAATKQRLEEQEKQLTMQTESVKPLQVPATVPPTTIPQMKPNFSQYKQGRPHNAMHTVTTNYMMGTNVPKTRVAPVNPSMLISMRHRDPRLARQQQAIHQSNNNLESVSRATETVTSQTEVTNSISSATKNEPISTTGNILAEKSPLKSAGTKSTLSSKEKSKSSTNSSGSISSGGNTNKRSHVKDSLVKPVVTTDGRSPTRSTSSSSNARGKSRSSSSRSSSSSKSSHEKLGKSRERESKSAMDRKKANCKPETSGRNVLETKPSSVVPKHIEKSSPKRYSETNKVVISSKSPETAKFKDLKPGTKSRNYMRRNRNKSKSPTPPPPPPPPPPTAVAVPAPPQDVDFRTYPLPDKRIKLDDTPVNVSVSTTVSNDLQSLNSSAPTDAVIPERNQLPPQTLDQNIEDVVSCKDVDLRQFPANPVQSTSSSIAEDIQITNPVAPPTDVVTDVKKRPSSSETGLEEPVPKKSKSEKIDTLFGTEDVDLRTLNTAQTSLLINSAMPMTPPPPPIISSENENWTAVKGPKPSKVITPKSSLEDVRAKLAKATKASNYHKPTEKDVIKKINSKRRLADNNEDSEDGTDANIRTIISQAQELLNTENMNVDQYNTLVKTVIQINETNKLKEAQRRESLLTKSSNNLEDLTPISDDEVRFSSEDEDEKAIPSVEKTNNKKQSNRSIDAPPQQENKSDVEQNTIVSRSQTSPNWYIDTKGTKPSKSEKRMRIKESKWSSRWSEQIHSAPGNQKPWIPLNNHRPPFIPKGPYGMPNAPVSNPRPNVPRPWENPPPLVFATNHPPPPIQLPQLNTVSSEKAVIPNVLLASRLSNSVDNPNIDVLRTINIDNAPKEIRFYEDVAIAFMDWDQPKEIGFQAGQRRIIIDDHEPITLNFNDVSQTVLVDGKPHQMRFGCPTRELYIDNNWYECFFGDPPIGIFLDGRVRVFKVEGPAPQVRIGNLRQDLVVGKINIIIDAHIMVPAFLDSKQQTFEVDGNKHTLQFADYLKTVLIDNEPISVEYGGLPISLYLSGVKHFVRFGALPKGFVPGKAFIKNMIRTEFCREMNSPLPPTNTEINSVSSLNTVPSMPDGPVPTISTASISPQSLIQAPKLEDIQENHIQSNPPLVQETPAIGGSLNIDELFQKLLASGILNKTSNVSQPVDESSEKKVKDKDIIKPIDLSKSESVKAKQMGIVQMLYCGMQCSSCGVRFPPEQTMKYSQHLDWHFRQNRRERDSTRRAHSRKWYYEVSDWIQYEEIEDLEDREKNWFESQQNELDCLEDSSNQKPSSPPPSCPAGPDDVDKICDMCHDRFEHFYNEESEEWHLRSAVKVEDKTYHPLCYEDYKASLTFEESQIENSLDDNAVDSVIVKTEKMEKEDNDTKSDVIIDDDDDDDDVIVVPMEEPSITEIPDDDDDDEEPKLIEDNSSTPNEVIDESDKELKGKESETNSTVSKHHESMESDVEIQEPVIPFTDLDTYEEGPTKSISTLDESSQSSQANTIKIKEEPKDDGYDDDAFEDVGTFVCIDDLSENIEEYVTHTTTTTVHDNLVTSMDGNTEIQDNPVSMTVGVNKIKINITKNVAQSQKSNISSNENASNTKLSSGSAYDPNDNTRGNHIAEVGQNNKSNIESTSQETCRSSPHDDNEENSVEFEFKPELQGVELKKVPRLNCGFETSGLCSIM